LNRISGISDRRGIWETQRTLGVGSLGEVRRMAGLENGKSMDVRWIWGRWR